MRLNGERNENKTPIKTGKVDIGLEYENYMSFLPGEKNEILVKTKSSKF